MVCLRNLHKIGRGVTSLVFQARHCSRSHNGCVYVYEGEGSTATCVHQMKTSLSCNLDHVIKSIDPRFIARGDWEWDCAAIVCGGGNTGGVVKALGYTGAERIKNFVKDGGTYIGVNAGAYLASELVLFRSGDRENEIFKRRPLDFFPGTCLGPVNKKYDCRTIPEDCWQPVSFNLGLDDVPDGDDDTALDTITLPTYVNGGGMFLPHCYPKENSPNVEILARFEGVAGTPAAAVKYLVGRGRAILCSPHLEMGHVEGGCDVRADDVIRAACWRWLLRQGKLKTVRGNVPPSSSLSSISSADSASSSSSSSSSVKHVMSDLVEFG